MPPACHHGANPLIEQYFHDCIYTSRDMLGFGLGLASIAFWMVAQIPQLVANYRRQRADALSPWFLAEWLLGDTFNLLGCLLKGDQLPTVVFTAQYFICMDAILLMQYMYFRALQHRRERTFAHRARRRHHWRDEGEGLVGIPGSNRTRRARAAGAAAAAGGLTLAGVVACAPGTAVRPAVRPGGAAARRLLGGGSLAASRPGSTLRLATFLAQRLPLWARDLGVALGYGSCVLYLLSRASQLYRNAVRRSAEGLALSMFFVAVGANLTYGASILVRAHDWPEVRGALPWLIGSLGTVALDVAILLQALAFGDGKPAAHAAPPRRSPAQAADGLHEPLLSVPENGPVHHQTH
ncbi:hypothetical protein ACKKBG_A18340 [Auxenochlorella protothecoides x Auxenochlorella symbiontica]